MKFNDQKAADQEKTRKDGETHVVTLPNINPENLNFEYWWEGPKAYQPVRVFSADGKVMIQMPADMKYGDAPALFILEKDQEQLTNYRLSGSYFVVDRLFTEARLVLGVGNDRTTVTIHAGRKPLWAGLFGN